jgi:FAD/FMN-containing dehydrogenase
MMSTAQTLATESQLAPSTVRRWRFDGQILTAGAPGYDSSRSVWNGMIDRRPALIVRCVSVADVVSAVRVARERDLEIGVRCGGHNIAGLAVPDGGLMIDLTGLNRVAVDPVARRARVQGGALLGALDRASQRFGLATTAGNVSHTGVGGLTLGGGMGWLARRHGLACDNVESFTVVTAVASSCAPVRTSTRTCSGACAAAAATSASSSSSSSACITSAPRLWSPS